MQFEKLKKQFPKIKLKEPMKNHCTLRAGGPAAAFYELTDIEDLPSLIILAEENHIPYCVIGRGSNVLFTDKGFCGLVIKNLSNKCSIKGGKIIADSGVLLAQIVRLSVDNNLTGLEPLWGIPGTIGGAVYGNAGVPRNEIGDFVKSATVFNAGDGIRKLQKKELWFDYRSSSLMQKREIVLEVTLKLKKIKKKSQSLLNKIIEIRKGKQPKGWSTGSFFKNPMPEKTAGWLIDQCGLKGKRLDNAQISEKHANFILNLGNASAAQILALADLAQTKVREKFGIELKKEVKVIGDL